MPVARHGFPRARRLLKKTDYTRVLNSRPAHREAGFVVHLQRNGLSHDRLGLVVSRKVSPRAVVRNRVKRSIRESFRKKSRVLTGYDVVVIASHDAARAPLETSTRLARLWPLLISRCDIS